VNIQRSDILAGLGAAPLTLAGVRQLLADLPKADGAAVEAARRRNGELTKPPGALGRLEEVAIWLAGWQGTALPQVAAPAIAVFAGNHGVTARGVSPYPADVTAQMVANFAAGGAAINQICAAGGVRLSVHPVELHRPTGDMVTAAALSEADCAAHMAEGMAAVPGECDLFGAGEMGIGNTTAAAAIYGALYGGDAARFVGRGTGVDDAGLARKAAVVEAALGFHIGHLGDPLSVLCRLGGREIAAIAGAILAARLRRIPVVLDGYVVTAAAAVLHAANPAALEHCVAGHCSAEGAHGEVLDRLGLKPLLTLGLRLGEGTGAALAMSVVKAAAACQAGMATFSSAGVANK
jgi:nicotinate-nucleotide--dimethylbenzimidazole phosphoribosyltransferase